MRHTHRKVLKLKYVVIGPSFQGLTRLAKASSKSEAFGCSHFLPAGAISAKFRKKSSSELNFGLLATGDLTTVLVWQEGNFRRQDTYRFYDCALQE